MESGGDNLGTIFLDVLLDTSKISAQLKTFSSQSGANSIKVPIGVDPVEQSQFVSQTKERTAQLRAETQAVNNRTAEQRLALAQIRVIGAEQAKQHQQRILEARAIKAENAAKVAVTSEPDRIKQESIKTEKAQINLESARLRLERQQQRAAFEPKLSNLFGLLPDPTTDPAISGAVKGKFAGFGQLLGVAAVSAIGYQVASMALPVVSELLKSSVSKAIDSANLNLALKATSNNNTAYNETLAASQSLSQKLATSELGIRQSLSSFQANIVDTPLEGRGNDIVGGLQKYGRLLGVDSQRISLATTAVAQSAGKGQLYSEEVFGQLAESLPGGAVQLAAASGLSVKQLRALLQSGGADAADMLSRFGGRLNAIGDAGLEGFENTPQAKLGKFGASVESLQVKLGESTLEPLATGADIASKAIDVLANSLGILGSVGGAALIKLAIDSGVAGAALTGLKGALDWQSFSQGIGGAKTALASFAATPMAAMLGELALLTLAVESVKSLADTFTGGNTPGKAIAEDMEKARASVEKLAKATGEISKDTISNSRDAYFDKSKTFLDRVGDFNVFNPLFGGEKIGTISKLIQDKTQISKAIESADITTSLSENYQPSAATFQQIQAKNRELQILKLKESTATGLDPQQIENITKRISTTIGERAKLEAPIQGQLVALEDTQKQLKNIVDDPFRKTDPAYTKEIEAAQSQLVKIGPLIAKLKGILSETTVETSKTALSLQEMNYRFGQSQIAIDRTNTEKFTELTDAFSGSLLKGARATAEYDLKLSTLNARIAAGTRAASDARQLLAAPEIAAQVKTLQQGGKYKLPENLADVTDEQLKNLETEAKVSKQIVAALRSNRDYASQLLKLRQEESSLIDARRTALTEERKATREYYFNTVTESKKLELASIESSRQIQQANLVSKFKVGLSGVSSAVGSYVNTLVDTFAELGNLTKIENERKQKEYDLQVQKVKAKIDYTNRNNASSESIQGAIPQTVMSPIAGTTLDSAIGYRPSLGMQSPDATRPVAGGGTRPHGAIDYGSAMGVKLGTPVQAVIDGTATYSQDVAYGYGKGRNHKTDQVILEGSIMTPEGQQRVKFQYFHLGRDTAKYFKDGFTKNVKAGELLGVVGADGKIGGNEYHLHFATWLNGKKVDDPRKVLSMMASGMGTPNNSNTPQSNNNGQIILSVGHVGDRDTGEGLNKGSAPLSVRGLNGEQKTLTLGAEAIANYVVATRASLAAKAQGLNVAIAMPDRQGTGKAGDEIRNSYYRTLRQQAISTGSQVAEIHFDDRDSGKPGYIQGKGDITSLDRAFATNYGYYQGNPKFGFPRAEGGTNRFNSGFAATNNGIDLIEIDKLSTNKEYGKAVAAYIKATQDGDTKQAAIIYKQLEDLADKLYVPKLVQTLKEGTNKATAATKAIPIPSATQKPTAYAPVTATVYFPGEGNIKMEGGKTDIYGKYIDRYSRVAATRTTDISGLGLPYGSVIELRNPKNNKTTKLIVRDRGSLQSGVDIDITPAATNDLGIPADGRNQLEMRVISTPKPISGYNLGSGKGSYQVDNYKVKYTGALGRSILLPGGSDKFEERQPYQGTMPRPMKYIAPATFSPTPGAIPDPTQGDGFPTNESIRQNNLRSYQVQVESLERQRQINDEDAKALYSNEIYKANAALRKAALERRKGLRDEELTKIREQRELEDNSENLGYKDNPDDKFRIQRRTLEREKKDRIERARFELGTISEEIKSFEETLANLKGTDRSEIKNPQQLQVLDASIASIAPSIKDRQDRAKWLNNYIKETDKFYDKYQADILSKYNVGKLEGYDQSRRESTASSIKVTQQEIQRITEFQKKRPFDLSQGDPLKLQAKIDTQQARLEYQRVDTELAKKAREGVNANDYDRQYEIERQQIMNRAEYKKKLENIDKKLAEDILERANKYSDYIIGQRLDLSAKEIEAMQAAIGTSSEQERLTPSFADVNKIQEAAIERQKEEDNYAKNRQAIVNKYGNDRNESARKLFDEESKAEKKRHDQTIAGINYRLRNAIVENDIARRQDTLDRARAISDSGLAVKSATGSLYGAEGKAYQARLVSAEVERANLQTTLAAELKAIEDFRLKNPTLSDQASFRAQNAQERYDKAIEAQSIQQRRDREANLFGLRQQVGGGQIEQLTAYSERFGSRGDIYGKETIDKQIALQQLSLARAAKLKELDELALANDGDDKAVEAIRQLREEFEALNKVKLDGIERQFSRFKGILDEANQAGGNLIGKALVGQSNGQDWLNLLSAPFKGITDAATKFLSSEYSKVINNLLGDLVKSMDSEFGNLGNGGTNKSALGKSSSIASLGFAGLSSAFNGLLGVNSRIDIGSLNAPYGGIFGGAPAKQQSTNLWDQGLKLLPSLVGGLLGFEQGGVILPNEPEGKGDRTLIRVNANESIMVPGFTRAMGGEKGIDYLNKMFANTKGFEAGGVPLPLPLPSMPANLPMLPSVDREQTSPEMGLPVPPDRSPIKLEYTKIGDREYIDREHLESRLNEHDRRQQNRLNEYNRQKDDTMRHSLQYRRQMGLIR